MAVIGFVGVGTISEAVIRAMCTRSAMSDTLVLSPRSERRSRSLADEFEACVRVESNQEVIDRSEIVVLAMRPQQLDEALAGLMFRESQVIASFIAGTPPSGIAQVVAPATQVCQLIPLPAVVLHKGPLLISPEIPEVMTAFAGLGDVVTLDDETRIRAVSCASAVMSTYYEMQNQLIAWLAAQGIPQDTASLYIRSLLEGLATVGRVTPEAERADLPFEHQTKGGLNERVRAGLLEQGWFDMLTSRIDEVYATAVLRKPEAGS